VLASLDLVLVLVGLVLVLVLAGPVLFLNLACNTHSIVLIVIYLFSVMGFTVICCEHFVFIVVA